MGIVVCTLPFRTMHFIFSQFLLNLLDDLIFVLRIFHSLVDFAIMLWPNFPRYIALCVIYHLNLRLRGAQIREWHELLEIIHWLIYFSLVVFRFGNGLINFSRLTSFFLKIKREKISILKLKSPLYTYLVNKKEIYISNIWGMVMK